MVSRGDTLLPSIYADGRSRDMMSLFQRTVIVFDELLNYNGFERHEMRALFEMMEKEGGVGSRLKLEWIGSKHAGCMSVAAKMVAK